MDRAAAAILGVAGAAVVAWVAVVVVDALPAVASDNPRQRDGALFGLILIGIPVLVGGLLTLLFARRLWYGHRRARTLALVWVPLSSDRHRDATQEAPKGQGDRGDRRR